MSDDLINILRRIEMTPTEWVDAIQNFFAEMNRDNQELFS